MLYGDILKPTVFKKQGFKWDIKIAWALTASALQIRFLNLLRQQKKSNHECTAADERRSKH